MGYMIEISESKIDKLAEHAEGAIRHVGKLMQCIEELQDGHMGERHRGRYGMRDEDARYPMREDGGRYGMRDWREDGDWDDPYMGERRGRSASTGRYIHR